jgi:hypothetical protein
MHRSWYDRTQRRVRDLSSWRHTGLPADRSAARALPPLHGCERERLAFLADNPLYTERFAWYVACRCRASSIKDIAEARQNLRLLLAANKRLNTAYLLKESFAQLWVISSRQCLV